MAGFRTTPVWRHAPAFALCAGLLALYAPTVWDLAHDLWLDATHSHGPFVLAGVAWLFMRAIREHAATAPARSARVLGWALLTCGLLIYALGRSQGLYVLEVGSAIPVLLGCVLIGPGAALARRLWFAFVFMLFLVPLPGSLIDTLTQPMKIAVSYAAEALLHWAGYPVARQGVVLGIGPYQLFVADACAGLNSLFMLEAFGLLYLNAVRHESALRNAVLAVLIVPISFVANVTRVAVLAWVTYHYGDAAGQGFIHSFSGAVLFLVALLLTVGADSLVRSVSACLAPDSVTRMRRHFAPASQNGHGAPPLCVRRASPMVAAGLVMMLVAAAAPALTPTQQVVTGTPSLDEGIPKQFGGWTMVKTPYVPVDVVAAEPGQTSVVKPYDQVVMRTYANADGQVVTLAVAYSANQRQEVKVHRPDLCYSAQGFRIISLQPAAFGGIGATSAALDGNRMYAESPGGNEAVSYWIRIGDVYSESAWTTRIHILSQGLKGRVTDGVLVRASQVVRDERAGQQSFATLEDFLAALVAHARPDVRGLLVH